jgi:hypothetical protein
LELSKMDDGMSFEVSLVKETPGAINVKVNHITDELASHNITGPVYFLIGGAGEQKKRIGQIDYADMPNKTQIMLNVVLFEVAPESLKCSVTSLSYWAKAILQELLEQI